MPDGQRKLLDGVDWRVVDLTEEWTRLEHGPYSFEVPTDAIPSPAEKGAVLTPSGGYNDSYPDWKMNS